MLIQAEKITKSYSEKALIKESSFYLSEGNKIGVIGINGAGKSTFLKIMAQIEVPDSGVVTKHSSAKIGYLSQDPNLNEEFTVMEQVLSLTDKDKKEIQEYEAKTILNKLGIEEFNKKICFLSGGQKKRVAIAEVLISDFDGLILDEPTNHLDNDMILWLESYLIKYAGAILMVTHDRYFLDRVVSKIVEIDDGNLYSYEGNYSKFLELKAQREEIEAGSVRKLKVLLKNELQWIKRGPKARGTKSKSRIDRFNELNENIDLSENSELNLASVSSRLGKKIIELNSVSKSFSDRILIDDFSHIVARDSRIGIVGPNGCGKSTLLNLISRRQVPDSGSIVVGETVKIGYFSQEVSEMDLSLRVIDYIKGFAEYIETVEGIISASEVLEKFLFNKDLQWNTIGRLSGGERRRLYLLSIIITSPNILLLDEPTNDLDIQTLIILEEYLESFHGAVIVVSHDRYFLDKVVDLIFEFNDGGTIKKYNGGYSDYIIQRNNDLKNKEASERKVIEKKQYQSTIPKKLKFTFKEQREFEIIDEEIASLEEKINENKKAMEDQASNFEKLQELLSLKDEFEEKLSEKMERWVYLNELADKIAGQEGNKK